MNPEREEFKKRLIKAVKDKTHRINADYYGYLESPHSKCKGIRRKAK